MTFTDYRNGWAVGKNGVILKYNSSLINIHSTGNFTPESFTLYQNYPNPFNPETIINYELGIRNDVSLKVYNALGMEVAVLVNENKPAGRYSVTFDGSGLSSGIYYYSLFTEGALLDTKRMVLLK